MKSGGDQTGNSCCNQTVHEMKSGDQTGEMLGMMGDIGDAQTGDEL